VTDYLAANPFDPWGALPFENSGRFFSWDLELLLGTRVRRLVSTYIEPTTLAPALALGLLLGMAVRERRRYGQDVGMSFSVPLWAVIATLIAGYLTVSKGFALFTLLLLSWRVLGIPSPRHVFLMAAFLTAGAIVLFESGYSEGAFSHAAGLATGWQYLADGNLWGEGLGAAGNYTDSDLDVGTESGLGNGIAQIGLAAFLPIFWIRSIAVAVLQAADRRRDGGGPWIAAWLLLWFLTYLLSASSLGVGGNALGFSMLALYLHPALDRSRSSAEQV
jgi:hypothetical protein